MMLGELRQVIPAFLSRVDQPNRGVRSVEYLADTRDGFDRAVKSILERLEEPDISAASIDDDVRLTDFDPEGETKVVAAALYSVSAARTQRSWRSRGA